MVSIIQKAFRNYKQVAPAYDLKITNEKIIEGKKGKSFCYKIFCYKKSCLAHFFFQFTVLLFFSLRTQSFLIDLYAKIHRRLFGSKISTGVIKSFGSCRSDIFIFFQNPGVLTIIPSKISRQHPSPFCLPPKAES